MKIDYNIREIPLLPVKSLKRKKSSFTCFICMLTRFCFNFFFVKFTVTEKCTFWKNCPQERNKII